MYNLIKWLADLTTALATKFPSILQQLIVWQINSTREAQSHTTIALPPSTLALLATDDDKYRDVLTMRAMVENELTPVTHEKPICDIAEDSEDDVDGQYNMETTERSFFDYNLKQHNLLTRELQECMEKYCSKQMSRVMALFNTWESPCKRPGMPIR